MVNNVLEKNKLEYNILIPPIKNEFEKMSSIDAEEYFQWYIDNIDDRIKYLKEYSSVELDYSVKSLIDIWSWFLKNAEIEKTPKIRLKELKKQLQGQPKEIVKDIIDEQRLQFSLQTEYIIRDIAMYFGEVYIKNNPSISWGYHTDINEDSFANMPVLMGFEDRDFNPPFKAYFELNFEIRNVAYNIFDGDQNNSDLLDVYNKWQRMVFN